MGTYTKNINLLKPAEQDKYDVNLRNQNWDKIDTAIGNANKALSDHKTASEIDHPDASVTTRKIRDKSITSAKLAEDVNARINDTNFVKNLTGTNDTLTVTKGNNSTAAIKVNNVEYAKQAGRLKSDYDFYSRLKDINQPSSQNGMVSYFCATNAMRNKPSVDAMVLQLGWDSNANCDGQLYVPNHNGSRIMFRTQNGSANWTSATPWKEIPYMDDVNVKVDATNGVINGKLTFKNAKNVQSGINMHDNGNFELGTDKTDHLMLLSNNRPQYYTARGGAKDLAIKEDLNAYLPLAGGTMTGTLTMNGAGQTIKNGNKSANITVSPGGVLDIGGTSTENINLYANNRPSWYKQNNGGAKALALLEELTSMDTALKALIGGINLEQLAKATGVKYDFSNENAWYICLGKAFGGLIIQGGYLGGVTQGSIVNFPLKHPNKCIAVVANDIAGNNYTAKALTTNSYTSVNFKAWGTRARDGDDLIYGHYISVGY